MGEGQTENPQAQRRRAPAELHQRCRFWQASSLGSRHLMESLTRLASVGSHSEAARYLLWSASSPSLHSRPQTGNAIARRNRVGWGQLFGTSSSGPTASRTKLSAKLAASINMPSAPARLLPRQPAAGRRTVLACDERPIHRGARAAISLPLLASLRETTGSSRINTPCSKLPKSAGGTPAQLETFKINSACLSVELCYRARPQLRRWLLENSTAACVTK